MSSTPARRRRLAQLRTLPQATCPRCGASLARVDFPARHLERCERFAAQSQPAAPNATPASWLGQRLRAALGIQTRGAAE